MGKPGIFILLLLLAISSSAGEQMALVSPKVVDKVKQKYGFWAAQRVSGWQRVMERNQGKDIHDKLQKVNDYFNGITYATDPAHWGLPDYWAHPIEMLVTYGGDCEDYAIAKYFTLLALGVANDDLRITYVKALEYDQAHMVLTWYGDNPKNPLVLDNIKHEILPASERSDLKPVYTFNADHLWMARERGKGILEDGEVGPDEYWANMLVGNADKLELWAKLLERMNTI